MERDSQLTFTGLVDRHRKEVLQWSLELTGNLEDAEDLSQEVFVKAHQAMSKFRGDSKWSTWLFRIARNTYLDRLKTARFKMRQLERPISGGGHWQLCLESQRPLDDPERNMVSNTLQKEIETAMAALPELQREVFVLRHYHGFKLREISEILQRSEGTVKKTLFRAIQQLRVSLAAYVPSRPKEV